MAIPEQGQILQLFEEQRLQAEAGTLFQTQRDFDGQDRWVREQVEKIGAPVHLFPTSSQRDPQGIAQSAGVDPLDGDILNPEFFTDPEIVDERQFNMKCILEHEPSKQMLGKYGIDEQREVGFHFVKSVLRDKGLVTKRRFRGIDIGDLVFWDGTWYIIQNAHRDHYFGQTVNNYFVVGFASRYTHDNVLIADVSDGGCPEDMEF